jgi:phospholipase/carboxylesterase
MKWVGPRAGAKAGIVLAHGRGGSADDILGLMDAAGLNQVAAVASQAPGQSWWPVSFLSPAAVLEPHVARGIAAMREGVDSLAAVGIPHDCIWLGGFSQGACLALETFARAGEGLAGCLGFSGGLVGTKDKGAEPSDTLYGYLEKSFDYAGSRTGAKVWLSVHEQDPHIPLRRARETADVMRRLGAEVDLQIHPGAGHGIRANDLNALRSLLVG